MKRYAEAITFGYHRNHGTKVRVVRIFNTYGPRMDIDDGRAIPAFVKAALAGTAIPLPGDGSQTRSLTYVGDLVAGILLLADSEETGPVNLGNPRELSLREIAELVVKITGSSSTIELQPRPVDDPERRKPDIALARATLGWEPVVAAEDGLVTTIAWFSETLSARALSAESPATAGA